MITTPGPGLRSDRQPNAEHIATLMRLINNGPYIKHLSMQIIDLGKGFADMELTLGPEHFNPLGGIHGGTYASLVDSAAFWAAYYDLEEGLGFTTLDLKVSYLAPARQGKLLGRGKCIKMGKTAGLGECIIYDQEGRLIAHGTSQLMATRAFQLINPEDLERLPAKFL